MVEASENSVTGETHNMVSEEKKLPLDLSSSNNNNSYQHLKTVVFKDVRPWKPTLPIPVSRSSALKMWIQRLPSYVQYNELGPGAVDVLLQGKRKRLHNEL